MTAPVEVRSIFGEVQTALPGVTFGGTFPQLAARADRLAVVRAFASNNADHQNYVAVAGANALKAPLGALYARIAGPNHPATGIPSNVLVTPEAIGPEAKVQQTFETDALKKYVAAGQTLGAAYGFFDPSGGGPLRDDLQLKLPRERFDDRRALLDQLDTFKRRADATGVFADATAYEQQACDAIVRGIGEAFDLAKEDPAVVARYDTSGLFTVDEVHKWGDMRRSSNLLGKQLLLARRLCEAGCGFVTVMDAGWDMHSNGNSPRGLAGMKWLGPQVDHAVSAFLDDLRDRGLSDKVLLIVTGEMGRTPKINKDGGRDPPGNLTPLLLAGGGLKMGQVVGESDKQAGAPVGEKYTPENLLATVMHTLFDVGAVRVMRGVPNTVIEAATSGKPIEPLL